MSYKTVTKFSAVFTGVLLLYAAVGQLQQYLIFSYQLKQFFSAVVPVGHIAWVVPLAEFVVAILLLMPSTRTSGLFAALFLLNFYTVCLTALLDERYAMPCHCGEPFHRLSLASHIVLNLGCLVLVCVGIGMNGRPKAVEKRKPRPQDVALLN